MRFFSIHCLRDGHTIFFIVVAGLCLDVPHIPVCSTLLFTLQFYCIVVSQRQHKHAQFAGSPLPELVFLCRYHSITLLKFMGLITDFFGGKAFMLAALSGQKVSPDPFPCCCCCCLPMVAINRYSKSYKLFHHLSIPHLCPYVDSVNPNLYVNAIICVSTFVSFYGHLLFYKATKSALHGYGLRAKFICIIVVLVLCGLQSGILETLGALEVIPCTPPFSVLTRSQSKLMEINPVQIKLLGHLDPLDLGWRTRGSRPMSMRLFAYHYIVKAHLHPPRLMGSGESWV
uniref:Si:dkey-16n15.6 n=1 Tax=Oryzias latipes TaxID=8090 RepID=A0A3P9JHF9_ORYLA